MRRTSRPKNRVDPDHVYWAQLPFAVIGTGLMAADWFCQVAPILFQAVKLGYSGQDTGLAWETPSPDSRDIHPAVLRRLLRRRAYRDRQLEH